jgi:drug/metabolite transporter (DMT)-like permease
MASYAPTCRYLGLNSFLNLLNRWALGLYGLKFPLIMTSCHMIFGSCALAPMMLLSQSYASRHASVLANDWKGLATIAVMNGFQIACNNASLTVMELSMNQVIRASIPVIVALLAVCIEGKVPSKGEVACLLVISLGVMLAVWEESRNAVLGIILTLISTVMQSIQMSLSGRVMSGRSGKLDSFQMTFYTGPVAFAALFPFAIVSEYTILAESLSQKPGATVGFLLGSCCVAVVYNVVLFQSVRTLSSVGTAILGNVKIVCLLFLSSLLLGELGVWSANQYLGCFLTFLAAGAYSYIKATAAKAAAPPAVAPSDKASGSAN